MRARDYIEKLAARGRYHFTAVESRAAISGVVRPQLLRLKESGLVAEPQRGFLVIVPAEYRHLGCLPADQFITQLMESMGEPYYFALLTAAERHGAAHQRPQGTQVMVRQYRKPLQCGLVRVEFVARADLQALPAIEVNTPRGRARYSTAEVTALELVGYPHHSGGLNNVATILAELAEILDGGRLLAAAALSPVSWAQRLGYLLEAGGHTALAKSLAPFVSREAHSFTPLRRAAGNRGSHDETWKVIVNVEVEPDL